MFGSLLGISDANQAAMNKGMAQLSAFSDSGGFEQLAERLKCADANLDAMRQLLEREYGRPMKNPISFDPWADPAMPNLATTATPQQYDLYADLQHSVVRGHIANLGDENVYIRFGRNSNDPQKPKWFKDEYELVPNQVFDFTFFFDVFEYRSTAPSKIQVFAQ